MLWMGMVCITNGIPNTPYILMERGIWDDAISLHPEERVPTP